jgi:hypothetical protein
MGVTFNFVERSAAFGGGLEMAGAYTIFSVVLIANIKILTLHYSYDIWAFLIIAMSIALFVICLAIFQMNPEDPLNGVYANLKMAQVVLLSSFISLAVVVAEYGLRFTVSQIRLIVKNREDGKEKSEEAKKDKLRALLPPELLKANSDRLKSYRGYAFADDEEKRFQEQTESRGFMARLGTVRKKLTHMFSSSWSRNGASALQRDSNSPPMG